MRLIYELVFNVFPALVGIAAVIGFILLVKLTVLIIKRLLFIGKIKRFCRANGIYCDICSRLRSIFWRGSKPDMQIEGNGKKLDVFVFSNIFKHSRYHFVDGKKIEIYHVGRGIVPFLGRNQLRTYAANPNGITTLNETKLATVNNFAPEKSDAERVMLVYPIPLRVTRVIGNGPCDLYDGELIFDDVKLYSGKGLRKLLLEEFGGERSG